MGGEEGGLSPIRPGCLATGAGGKEIVRFPPNHTHPPKSTSDRSVLVLASNKTPPPIHDLHLARILCPPHSHRGMKNGLPYGSPSIHFTNGISLPPIAVRRRRRQHGSRWSLRDPRVQTPGIYHRRVCPAISVAPTRWPLSPASRTGRCFNAQSSFGRVDV